MHRHGRPAELVRIVDRVGRHGRAYVLPREALGNDDGERIMFQSEAAIESPFEQRGTAEQWRSRIGALSQHLQRAAETTFGTVGREWLEHLTRRTDSLPRLLRERIEAAEADMVPEAAAGQVQRVGRRFALAGVAGEMATEAGFTGWPAGEAHRAARWCFEAWLAARPGGIGLSEEAQMLRQVRGWFGLHGDARFTDWSRADDDHAPKTMNRAGWRKPIKTAAGLDELTGWEWFVLADVFRVEVCKGYSERAVARLLQERGHLHTEGKRQGFTCKAKPPGAHDAMVYRVRSTVLGDIED